MPRVEALEKRIDEMQAAGGSAVEVARATQLQNRVTELASSLFVLRDSSHRMKENTVQLQSQIHISGKARSTSAAGCLPGPGRT